ncbi:radical SAM family heme chaperone HemW [Hugenholtzia roseola]|uniref:radical SAM family heme chaperone HemW n=1 Tax=Hugenholtzia roseola TaxID=1002 RepID=UPI00040A3CB6|nr:radical SAM family heme chaperone HemW [Hugenholtzia roseola]
MSGIYFHIPFCKQACHYCDFHFVTSLRHKEKLLEMMQKEVRLRKQFFPTTQALQSVYFGGGTPSLLEAKDIAGLLKTVRKYFTLAPKAEITLEANPDDLTEDKLRQFWEIGINRLSIGIQSFDEQVLKFMNRSHSAAEARACVERARAVGFNRLSLDLIYAYPNSTIAALEKDLDIAINLGIDHLSAYTLTIEPKTAFGNALKKGRLQELEEDLAAEQFSFLVEKLEKAGFEQYEISNFAKNGAYAVHNTAYWQEKPYLGIGASAHSYDGKERFVNFDNNHKYMTALEKGEKPYSIETLSPQERLNDYILTSLRTIWGTDLVKIKNQWHYDLYQKNFNLLSSYQKQNLLTFDKTSIKLTKAGRLLADEIAWRLFW